MVDSFNVLQDEVNRWAFADLLEISEYEINSLRLVIAQMKVLEPPEDIAIGATVIQDTRAIETDETCAMVELRFADYVAYAVRNESYIAGKQGGRPADAHFRTYSQSPFLDYVGAATFANEEWPGSFTQYTIHCVNHVVDVASQLPPTVTRLR